MYAWNAFGSYVEKSRVVVLTRIKIWVGPRALFVEEEHVVLRQPPCTQVPFVVGCVLFVVECSFCLQKKIDI